VEGTQKARVDKCSSAYSASLGTNVGRARSRWGCAPAAAWSFATLLVGLRRSICAARTSTRRCAPRRRWVEEGRDRADLVDRRRRATRSAKWCSVPIGDVIGASGSCSSRSQIDRRDGGNRSVGGDRDVRRVRDGERFFQSGGWGGLVHVVSRWFPQSDMAR